MFTPDYDEPVIGRLEYLAGTASHNDRVMIHILVSSEYFRVVERIADRVAANLNGYDLIAIGVFDMRDDWHPTENNFLWVDSAEFACDFRISADPEVPSVGELNW